MLSATSAIGVGAEHCMPSAVASLIAMDIPSTNILHGALPVAESAGVTTVGAACHHGAKPCQATHAYCSHIAPPLPLQTQKTRQMQLR